MRKFSKNTNTWFRGILAAFIGGGASSVAAISIDPDKFNLTSLAGAGKTILLACVSGGVNAAHYLARSPLPPDTQEISETKKTTDGDGNLIEQTNTKAVITTSQGGL